MNEEEETEPCGCGCGGSGCLNCRFEPFSRNHYFTGKLLTERDFTDETHYHREKHRHHQLRLHGSGVVCGLLVGPHPNPACRDRYVVVTPGAAVDCCGNDILVAQEETLDVLAFPAVAALVRAGDDGLHTLQICVRFRECPTEEIPVLFDDCGCDDTQCAPNRILESYAFDVLVDPAEPQPPSPLPTCDDILWSTQMSCLPACDRADCVVLATLTNYRVGFTLEAKSEPPAAPDDPAADQSAGIARIDNRAGRKLLVSTQVLMEWVRCVTKNGTKGDKGDTGATGPAGPGLEEELVQIKALSWLHGQRSEMAQVKRAIPSLRPQPGLVIAFTDTVQTKRVDAHLFEVQVETSTPELYKAGWRCRCPIFGEVVPVKIDSVRADGTIEHATEITAPEADAIAFLIDDRLEAHVRLLHGFGDIWIKLRGDFVLDTKGRAIDAEFVRGELPTGDRPHASTLGIQGGVFESWIPVSVG